MLPQPPPQPPSPPPSPPPKGSNTSPTEQPKSFILSINPPPVPDCWVWICPGCSNQYKFAATTRCLYCGYRTGEQWTRLGGKYRPVEEYLTYFDYTGWRMRMVWARAMRGVRVMEAGKKGNKGDGVARKEGRRGHDCFWDCDYPGACTLWGEDIHDF